MQSRSIRDSRNARSRVNAMKEVQIITRKRKLLFLQITNLNLIESKKEHFLYPQIHLLKIQEK